MLWSAPDREGEWLGRDWLRVSRGADPRAGALARERRLKGLRAAAGASEERVRAAEAALTSAREGLQRAEGERETLQAELQRVLEQHADRAGALQAARARAEHASLRGERLQQDAGEVAHERTTTATAREHAANEIARAPCATCTYRSRHDAPPKPPLPRRCAA